MSFNDFENIFMFNNDYEVSIPTENAMRIFSGKLSKSQVFRNLYIYAQIEESGINLPNIKKVFPVDDERWGVLEDNLNGKTLLAEMNENPENYDEYLETMIELQTAVYDVRVNDLLSHKEMLEVQIKALKVVSEEKRTELLKTLYELKDDSKLIHGNFGPEYIITDKNDTLYVVNWSSVASGSVAADAAAAYLNVSCVSTEAAEQYLKLFSKKTGCEKSEIRNWIPLAAASQLSIGTVSILQRAFVCAWLDIDDDMII